MSGGATCNILAVAIQKIGSFLPLLQLYGAGESPQAEAVDARITKGLQDFTKACLEKGPHTLRDLECLLPLRESGRLTDELGQALESELAAALDREMSKASE